MTASKDMMDLSYQISILPVGACVNLLKLYSFSFTHLQMAFMLPIM